MKKSRAKQRGTSKAFEVFRVRSATFPSCLAGYFTWPQVALTHHAFHRAYTHFELVGQASDGLEEDLGP
jgi:hypothetical protein